MALRIVESTSGYESAFGTWSPTEEEVDELEGMYTFQEHCCICDSWELCSGGICASCDLMEIDVTEFL